MNLLLLSTDQSALTDGDAAVLSGSSSLHILHNNQRKRVVICFMGHLTVCSTNSSYKPFFIIVIYLSYLRTQYTFELFLTVRTVGFQFVCSLAFFLCKSRNFLKKIFTTLWDRMCLVFFLVIFPLICDADVKVKLRHFFYKKSNALLFPLVEDEASCWLKK